MDKSNLIDFNNDTCYKVSSPLIPAPKSTIPRLSDIENNPFDKCLRKIADKDDPFECNSDTSFHINIIEENKENVGHLISPVQTPVKSKRYKKISSSPLYITNNSNDLSPVHLQILSDIQNLNSDCNVSDTSLQILNDSVLDNNDSFNLAYNIPLPNSPEKNHLSTEQMGKKLSVISSITSKDCSFHLESVSSSGTSHVFSSVTSKDYDDNQLNKAFLNENSNTKLEHRRCLSARKPSNNIICVANTTKPTNLNNSFAGFNYNSRNIKFEKFTCDNYNDDSVFLEATHLAEVFRTSAALADLDDEDISHCSPPWVEENILFVDEDETNVNPENPCENNICNIPLIQVESPRVLEERKENVIELSNEKIEHKNETISSELNSIADYDKSDIENKKELKNAKDLLHNLTEILSNSGTVVDKRKLGESLLNSLALALNIENPNVNQVTETSKSFNKLQKSKSDSKIGENSRNSLEKQEFKASVPKIKTHTAAPVKLEKNLKLRNEKEKVTSTKGPLKALLPVTNMAKNKKSIVSKVSLQHAITPPKQQLHSLYQIKKTSTPNEHKLKPPIAQSTPEVIRGQGNDHRTPISKRHFGLAVSPLSKPISKNDISNTCFNNSLSPKRMSGSVPNIDKSAISSLKQSTHSSIPTVTSKISRRNSVSDMATSSSKSLNRSYDNSEPIRPPVQLKRSSSFQSKSSIQKPNIDNNNTVKKYGMPGTLKSLRLVKK